MKQDYSVGCGVFLFCLGWLLMFLFFWFFYPEWW
jgi:hypothetical protein